MTRILAVPVFVGLLIGILAGPVTAQDDKLWLSPLKAEEWQSAGIPYVMTVETSSPSTAVKLSTSDNSRRLTVQIPLTVPGDLLVWSVTLCYQTSDPATAITRLRLVEVREPTFSFPRHNDFLYLNASEPECHTSELLDVAFPSVPFRAQGSLTLMLEVDFDDISHTIEIGGISLNTSPITVDAPVGVAPGQIALRQNVPNPFAASTTIAYELPSAGPVELLVFDVAGRKIRTLEQGEKAAGSYQVVWDGRDDRGEQVAAGVYFYQARIGNQLGSKRMVLAR